VSVGPDGGTHQALEDVALMRVVPNMTVIVPVDAIEAKKATVQIASNNLPTYLRLFREKSPILTDENTYFQIGEAQVFYETSASFPKTAKTVDAIDDEAKKKIVIFANGEMVSLGLSIVSEIEKMGVNVAVVNISSVKPLDERFLTFFCDKYKKILVVEETQIAGGLGSAILEFLAKEERLKDKSLQIIGVRDRFGQSGTKQELYKEYGLDEKSILRKALEMLD
jgi:transketolase